MRVKVWAVRVAPPAVSVAAGVFALGPVLGPGFALRYDMVFVPDPPLTAVTMGAGEGFPRAVPSDAVVAALSVLFPADLVQSLLLLAIFVLGGTGAARLVPGPLLLPRLAAAVYYVWNPFVAERLLLGQWAMLLGYAGLPWVLAAAVRSTRVRDLPRVVAALIPAAVGGFSSIVLSALVALPAAVFRRRPARGAAPVGMAPVSVVPVRAASAVSVLAALLLVSLPWLIPALGSGARTDPAAVDLFAARADGPFGVVGSLLVLGGVWNAQAVPEWYGIPVFAACRSVIVLAALSGWVWLLRCGARRVQGFGAGLSVAAAVGLGIALLGVSEPGRDLLRALIGFWPGFGLLRDGQLYVAPLALLQAVGFGGAVGWVLHSAGIGGTAPATAGEGIAGHDDGGDPGEPLISSEADSALSEPVRFSRLWTNASARRFRTPHPHTPHPHTLSPHALRPRAHRPSSSPAPVPAPVPVPASGSPRRGERAVGAAVATVLLLAPLALLPGLGWAAAGRLAPVRYPAEWAEVQRLVERDPRPGAVLSLPWSAYRGLDWAEDGRTVVVLDPAVKTFGRRVVWNDDLRVASGGEVRVIEGEDPLARSVDPLVATGWPLRPVPGTTRRLGESGVRYVLLDREAARRALASRREADGRTDAGSSPGAASPDTAASADENRFSIYPDGAEVVHDGPRLTLLRLPDRHVRASIERLSGLEVTGWFVTVGAILWSMVVSGSNLVPVRPARSAGMGTRKENHK